MAIRLKDKAKFGTGLNTIGTIDGLTLAGGGITGTNYNIAGVNQLTIQDPGEGIVFTGTNNVTLAAIDDSADNIMNFAGAAELRVNNVRVLTTTDANTYLKSNAADTFSGILTGTSTGENLKIGGIRGTTKGSQSGEYIHLYERVHIGGPNGWGAASHGAPSNGLSTWGSIDVGMNGSGVIQLDGTTIVTAARELTNVTLPYASLTGTAPTWNQSTSGNAATATNSTQLNGYTLARIDNAEAFHTLTGIVASGGQAKRYHIGRLYGCPAHWDGNWQNLEIRVTAEGYESGHMIWRILGDYGGANTQSSMMDLYLKEATGPMCNRFNITLGSPVDAGWDHSGADTYYVDLYADAAYYSSWEVNIKTYGHGTQNSNPTSGGATTVIYDSPSSSNISDFNLTHASIKHLGYEMFHTGHVPTYGELGTMSYTNLTGVPSPPSDFVSRNNGGIFSGAITIDQDLFIKGTGSNGNSRILLQNTNTPAGYGLLKQRAVNSETVSGQSTHTGTYGWYTIKIPSGYSNQGLGNDIEFIIRTGGRHHNGKTLLKYVISAANGSTQSIGNLNGINVLQTLDTRIEGSYGGTATAAVFYYRTDKANNTGEVVVRVYRADREPISVVEINPIGAWHANSTTYTPKLTSHGFATDGGENTTRPSANITEIPVQVAGWVQTEGDNGKLLISSQGHGNGHSQEIARFINLGTGATSSYMYIGASSGTDWRLGKNINGTAGNTNFGIAKHSGTTLALEIDGSNNISFSNNGTFSGDLQAAGLYVGSTNTSFDFYNNGTSYLNGATTIDADTTLNGVLTVNSAGVNTYGRIRGFGNDNHFITMRGIVGVGTSTLSITGGHRMTFVEHADEADEGWYFVSKASGNYTEMARIDGVGQMYIGGNKVWHQGNDGAGTGLDADTVDGNHTNYNYGVGKTYDITVYGDTDKYYPVVISGGSSVRTCRISVYRSYSEHAPDDWNTSTHKGGLTLDYEMRFGGWGGYPNMLNVINFGEIYSRLCGGIEWTAHTMKHVIWLRGGGTGGGNYHIESPMGNLSIEVNDSTTASNYVDSTNNGTWYSYDNSNNAVDVTVSARTQAQADVGGKDMLKRMPMRYNGTYSESTSLSLVNTIDAATLNGYPSSTATTANTMALRNANGDIAAREIILSSSLSSQTPTVLVSMYPTTNQLVRTTPAAVAASMNLSGTNTGDQTLSGLGGLPLTGGTLTGALYGPIGRFRKSQTDNDYTSAALWTESYDSTGTGIAFHISGIVGKFLEMRTNGTLYWGNSEVLTVGGGTVTGNLNVNGNTNLGNGNGDITHINDILYVGATDSGDSHFYFGEDSSSWYGEHWHWDSGHTTHRYSRHAGTDTLIEKHDTRETHKIQTNRAYERLAHSTGYQIGSYNSVGGNSTKTNPIYVIGDNYRPSDTSMGNMYGIGFAHSNLWGSGKTDGWGLYVADNGSFTQTFTLNGIWSLGTIKSANQGTLLGTSNYTSTLDARYLNSDIEDSYTPKRLNIGASSNWDAVGFANQTNVHLQGHNQFWIGAGNATWFSGTANTKSSASGLAADATNAHDLLITTMQATSTCDRGITFAVDTSGAGTTGYRLGKWHSSNEQHSSKLTIDGGLHVRGGDMANYDYYADDYSSYWDNQGGQAYWGGDSGWIDPSITAGNAIQIQAGNNATHASNPALQFHQYGYGGIQMRYDGPNDYFHIESTGSSRFDWMRVKTDHGYIEFGPANTGHAHIYTDRSNFYFNKKLIVNGGTTLDTNSITTTSLGVGTTSIDSALTVYKSTTNGERLFNIGSSISNTHTGHIAHTAITSTATNNGWYSIGTIGDSKSAIVIIKTAAHSGATLLINRGYGPSGHSHVQALSTTLNGNGGYATIKAVRVHGGGLVDIQLTWSSGPNVEVEINVYGNGWTFATDLRLSAGGTGTYPYNVLDTYTFEAGSGHMRLHDKLITGGDIKSGGDVIAYATSDREFKDSLIKIDNPLHKISKLNGYYFNWNDKQTTYTAGTKDIGIVAQEVEEVLPEIVTTRENGHKAVRYEKMIALLLEGMKEMKEEIEELKKQIK